ncbi:MAG: hypothetical protein JNK60_06890, partial [Acidobacteria bacterium]|nr:hypothetical protein [Acidobacteriota bacterium]
MHRFLRPFAALLFLSSLALAETEGRKPPETYLGPYVVVAPQDPRLAALGTLPSSLAPGPNAAGVLLEVPPPFGDEGLRETVRLLVKNAHAAGRKAGLWISLPEVAAPASDRAAEAANAESLVPGLGRLLEASAGLDLVALALPEQSSDASGIAGRRFLVRKVAAEVRARSPKARIALVFAAGPDGLFAPATSRVLDEEIAAFVDVVGLTASPRISGEALRTAADALSFGRPLLVRVPSLDSPDALVALAGRLAAFGVPHVAAPLASKPETDIALDRLGRLLDDDAARDGRSVTATLAAGTPLPAFRVVAGVDLGGLVVVPATDAALAPARGPVSLALDAPSYARAEITELATGRSRAFDIPLTKDGPTLTLSTATGSLAVRLTAREKAPADATKAASGVTAVRGLTAEEILARHQTWRAARDARWSRLSARNQTTLNFRFANLTTTLDYTLSGPFFFEKGAGYDWVWQEAYFNGVKWKGKKVPELPLIQPEKVTEVPLALTFNDSYRYELEKEAVVDGVSCYVLRFEPREGSKEKILYQGRVHVAKDDFALVRAETRQLGLSGEV